MVQRAMPISADFDYACDLTWKSASRTVLRAAATERYHGRVGIHCPFQNSMPTSNPSSYDHWLSELFVSNWRSLIYCGKRIPITYGRSVIFDY